MFAEAAGSELSTTRRATSAVESARQALFGAIQACLESVASEDAVSKVGGHTKGVRRGWKAGGGPHIALFVSTTLRAVRATPNVQTRNTTLLALCHLAQLAPEEVMSGLLPILRWMGQVAMQQDDQYSFYVTKKIIQTVVPSLVDHESETAGAAAAATGSSRLRRRSKIGCTLRWCS